jgi:hypothetical protein
MAFDETSLQWMIHNQGKDPITFQLALSSQVKVLDAVSNGPATIARGTNRVTLTGFDTITNTPTGVWLSVPVNAGATKSISLK